MLDRPKHRPQVPQTGKAAKISWPLPEDLTDRELDQLLFDKRPTPPSRRSHPAPDFPAIRRELETHKNLTLELAWREYQQVQPNGYRYSRYVAAIFMLRDHLKTMTVPRTGSILAT